jgi:hypothetical protein
MPLSEPSSKDTLAGQEEQDSVACELGAVSAGARALAFVRLLDRGARGLRNGA